VLRPRRLSREIDEELESHIEEAIAQGRDPAEARRAFGSRLRRREDSRDIRLIVWLDALRADAVFGWRQLMKRKIASVAAILSLALATGACTSAFRLLDALLLRPLPIAAPGRLYFCFNQSFLSGGQPMTLDGSPDARSREGSGGTDRHLLRRAQGSDLRIGSGDGKSVSAVRIGVDVQLFRIAARLGTAAH
jgi:hypothetical protein